MASISSKAVRVAPQQKRSALRFAAFLDTAAELMVDVGYEAATMTAIAERSGSSIGALYNYFSDKQSIAFTLARQYAEELEAHWKPVMGRAGTLSPKDFSESFIECITQFVRERPAYPVLLAAPIRFRRDPAARRATRATIASALCARNPSLTKEQALLSANVFLQIVGGMMRLYGETESRGKDSVIGEFKKVLTLYLGSILSEEATSTK